MKPAATLDDLMKVEGRAELIGGRIVHYKATGSYPGAIAGNIFMSLRPFASAKVIGRTHMSTVAYGLATPLASGRQSFSPNVSFYSGPPPANRMSYISGVPTLAVEIRTEWDCGRSFDGGSTKRDDYFEAGTTVVWDVDPLAETVTKYTPTGSPVVFRRGDTADTEPAVPGWTMAVADVFEDA